MEKTIRTTIVIPQDLYEQLRLMAFSQRTTISQLVREGISRAMARKKVTSGGGIKSLLGKYALKGKAGIFERRKFYEKVIEKKMSFRH